MDIVKKNLLSIVCGVVALTGIIVWFVVIGGMYEGLEAKVKTSAGTYSQVDALSKTSYMLPTLVVQGGEQQPLGRFPNAKVIEVGEKATADMAAQSTKMIETVSKLNVHTPLVPGSLPKPDKTTRIDFGFSYLAKLGLGQEGWADAESLPAIHKATIPPSTEMIEAKAEDLWAKTFAVRVLEIGGKNNLDVISDQFNAKVKTLPDEMRSQAATSHMIYMNEDALPVSPAIIAGDNPTDTDIWVAQTSLWIVEDVLESITLANEGAKAKNVLDAPVKHLVSIQVPLDIDQLYVTAGGKAAGGGAAAASGEGGAAAIPTDANGAPAVWSKSPTGRVSNDLYDVVHFGVVLRCDARLVPQVLAELERNQLVTVLDTNAEAIDAAEALKQNGYVYGDAPVVELTLRCEALFLRSWTVNKDGGGKGALMPDEVQQAIGIKAKAAEGGAGAGEG